MLIACHQHVFDWFGGLTEELLYDHPKTVVLEQDREGRGSREPPSSGTSLATMASSPPVPALSGADKGQNGPGPQVPQTEFCEGPYVSCIGCSEPASAGVGRHHRRSAHPW